MPNFDYQKYLSHDHLDSNEMVLGETGKYEFFCTKKGMYVFT